MGGLGLGAIIILYFLFKAIGRAADGDKDPEEGRWTDPPSEGERSPGSVLGELTIALLIGLGIGVIFLVVLFGSM